MLGNTTFISRVEHDMGDMRNIMFNTRNKSGISKHPCIFLFIYINYRFSNNIKCPEAMIGDCLKSESFIINKTPAKAFTPPAESKMGTRPGRAVTREFIERGVYSLISVLHN